MRVTIRDIHQLYARGERITMITAYDYTSAQLVDLSGIPVILVGDTLGMVVQGHPSTLSVTVEDVVYHTAAVTRGAKRALVVADLPFLTYTSDADALRASGRLIAEGGAQSVKLEGGRTVAGTIRRLVDVGIPVMAHLGYTPQSVHQIGLRVQGKDVERARQLLDDALAVQEAGAWAVVLELIPSPLAEAITQRLSIPTIGIGAGPLCSGEVQVWHDILGLYEDHVPRHTRRYRTLGAEIRSALKEFDSDVKDRRFPTDANSARMDDDVLRAALQPPG